MLIVSQQSWGEKKKNVSTFTDLYVINSIFEVPIGLFSLFFQIFNCDKIRIKFAMLTISVI